MWIVGHGAGGFSPAFLKSVLENGPGIGRSAEDHFVPASTQVMQGAPRLPCQIDRITCRVTLNTHGTKCRPKRCGQTAFVNRVISDTCRERSLSEAQQTLFDTDPERIGSD
jgi:hypothetical protein